MSGFTHFQPLTHSRTGHTRPGFRALLSSAVDGFRTMVRVATSRRYLAEMDDSMLHDLGISRAQANFEASRAPWQTKPVTRR